MEREHDFWPDLGYGLLILLGIAFLLFISYWVYQLWRHWHWIVWVVIAIPVTLLIAAILGHLARDIAGDRGHRH